MFFFVNHNTSTHTATRQEAVPEAGKSCRATTEFENLQKRVCKKKTPFFLFPLKKRIPGAKQRQSRRVAKSTVPRVSLKILYTFWPLIFRVQCRRCRRFPTPHPLT